MERTRLKLDVSSTPARRIAFYLTLAVLPVVTGVVCLCIGRYTSTAAETLAALGRILTTGVEKGDNLARIIRDMRLPRIVLALLVGGGLSVAGLAFQSLFANPMATPDTLGVAGGASFGAVLALLVGAGSLAAQTTALLTGFGAVGLTMMIGQRRGSERSLTAMILGGMIVSSLFSALISLVKLVADTDSKLPAITYWLMGSLSDATWYTVGFALPFILLGVGLLWAMRWRLNLISLGEEEARSLGVDLKRERNIIIIASTLLTASAVSVAGTIGWVGLIIPHVTRRIVGSDNKRLIPTVILVAAAFMMLVDLFARNISGFEIPLGVLTGLIGAPLFGYILVKQRDVD